MQNGGLPWEIISSYRCVITKTCMSLQKAANIFTRLGLPKQLVVSGLGLVNCCHWTGLWTGLLALEELPYEFGEVPTHPNLFEPLFKTGKLVLYPDPPPKRKGGSGEYSTSSHHGLAVAMDSAKS